MTSTRFLLFTILVLLPGMVASQSFQGGAGTEADPWLVATPAQLNDIRNFRNNHFRQTADIDLSGFASGEGWEPIGTETAPFHGTFDGNGFKITGLRINRPAEDQVGLFGTIARLNFTQAAKLENVVVDGGLVIGRFDTGGLVGYVTNNATSNGAQPVINFSSFKGSVVGHGNQTGGLVGRIWGGSVNYSRALAIVTSSGVRVGALVGMNGDISDNFAPGFIWNSYAKGYAQGEQIVGGLVGVQGFGKILESYASVVVKGEQFVGGLAGTINFNSFASNTPEFRNNYWNSAFSGVSVSVVSTQYPNIATPLTSDQFRDPSNFAAFNPSNNAGFDFDTKWQAGTGRVPLMPSLRAFSPVDNSGDAGFFLGMGTLDQPFLVNSIVELDMMRYFTLQSYRLTATIDMNDFSSGPAWLPSRINGWDDNLGFMPIGTADKPFRGNFDGGNHEIRNLYINRITVPYGGLFGMVTANADTTVTIKNLGLPNADVRARGEDTFSDLGGVGILAGRLGGYTTVENIWVTGKVHPQRTVCGGLAGVAQGSIRSVSVFAEVSCPSSAGGLAGRLGVLPADGFPVPDVEDIAVSGSADAVLRVGGLTGEAYRSNLSRIVASTRLSGFSDTPGALYPQRNIGASVPQSVTAAFWNSDISGTQQHDSGTPGEHGTGLSGNAAFQQASYTGFDFTTIWDIHDGHSMPFLRNNDRTRTGRIVYTGAEGMRMLASPIEQATYAQILEGRWTQGATGASVNHGSPNVFSWSNAGAGSWLPVTDLNETAGAFLVGIFENDALSDATASTSFPKTSFHSGRERTGGTVALNPDDDGFTLVGNPFFSAISWGNITKSGVYPIVYVWDVNSGWLSFNGVSGSLTGGLIAPFQSFLVATMPGQAPSMTIGAAARATGGSFRGKTGGDNHHFIAVEATDAATGSTNTTWIEFASDLSAGLHVGDTGERQNISEGQSAGEGLDTGHISTSRDAGSALRLEPLNALHAEVYSLAPGGLPLDIQRLAYPLHALDIPLVAHTSRAHATILLSAGQLQLPEGWIVSLLDESSGTALELTQSNSIALTTDTQGDLSMLLRIQPGQTTSIDNETADIPLATELRQNWPNPFNPATTIGFTIGTDLAQGSGIPVELTLYDLTGRRVATLFSGTMGAGTYSVPFDASALSSGIYIYRLQAGSLTESRRMTLIK